MNFSPFQLNGEVVSRCNPLKFDIARSNARFDVIGYWVSLNIRS